MILRQAAKSRTSSADSVRELRESMSARERNDNCFGVKGRGQRCDLLQSTRRPLRNAGSFRQIDQDDIGVLARAVEYDLAAVACDIEGVQAPLIAEAGGDQTGLFA
jgi:hypothetical protein